MNMQKYKRGCGDEYATFSRVYFLDQVLSPSLNPSSETITFVRFESSHFKLYSAINHLTLYINELLLFISSRSA